MTRHVDGTYRRREREPSNRRHVQTWVQRNCPFTVQRNSIEDPSRSIVCNHPDTIHPAMNPYKDFYRRTPQQQLRYPPSWHHPPQGAGGCRTLECVVTGHNSGDVANDDEIRRLGFAIIRTAAPTGWRRHHHQDIKRLATPGGYFFSALTTASVGCARELSTPAPPLQRRIVTRSSMKRRGAPLPYLPPPTPAR